MSSGKNGRDDKRAEAFLRASVRRFLSEHQLHAVVDVRDEDGNELDDARKAQLASILAITPRDEEDLVTLAGLGELAAGLSHESRNALTVALSFTQVGKRRATEEKAQELFGEVESQLLRGIDLLSDFLILAPSKSVTTARGTGPLDLRVVADKVTKIVRPQLRLKRVSIRVEAAAQGPLVWANERDVFQIVLNLLINAMHATPTNGDVVVHVEANGDLRIINTGPPILDDLCDRLFEPFFTTKDAGHGTGLGLAVSRRLAEANSGSLVVVRGKEEGAEFVLSLPSAPRPPEQEEA